MKYILCSLVAPASKEAPLLICKLKTMEKRCLSVLEGRNPSQQLWLQLPGRSVNKVMGEKKLLLDLLSQTTDGIYLRADFKMRF